MSALGLSGALLLLSQFAAAALPVEVLQEGGPASNRINLVILGDGYRAEDQQKLTDDARTIIESLFTLTPYAEYRSLFNIKLIKAVSNENGGDRGDVGEMRDTRYGSYFFCNNIERLVCANTAAALKDVRENVPEFDYVVMLVNDTKYGGSGGSIVVLSTNKLAVDILKHELGHVIGDLADEYESPYPGYPTCSTARDCPEANVTLRSTPGTLKWAAWVEAGTPIPTPETAAYSGIGLFEGARYLSSTVFRPVNTRCRMRELLQPFCSVCAEQMTISFLANVKLTDEVSPAPGRVSLCEGPATLAVKPIDLKTGSFSLRWLLDGVVKAVDQNGFQVEPSSVSGDGGVLELQVAYSSALLRRDAQSLKQSIKWTFSPLSRCDAGAPDGGAADAGFSADSGSVFEDAGVVNDAGIEGDAGSFDDAGSPDPQPVDAGDDAGSMQTVTVDSGTAPDPATMPVSTLPLTGGGCGCQSGSGLAGMVLWLALAATRRRPRGPRSANQVFGC